MLEKLSKDHKVWISMAISICRDKSTAEEMVQEMYLRLYNSGKKYEEINNSYIYVVISNCFKSHIKIKNRNIRLSNDYNVLDNSNNIEQEIIKQENEDSVINYLKCLTKQQREVMEMKYYKQMKYKEISKETGLKLGNVCQIVRRASIKLKKQ